MAVKQNSFFDKLLAFIYFIGVEVLIYFCLTWLLFDQEKKNPDVKELTITNNWNIFIYFLLLYATITVTAMLLLSTMLPRPYKPTIMRYFWWSWLGLLVMVVIAFN